ncbi:MAG TPA: sigma-70 family RNA polymerase sigma factor [Gemmatimonadaceae bacterium]|nr:sigma-70 family RNA polymerase sigma factor [Gemmatimonadaceae bacterium]
MGDTQHDLTPALQDSVARSRKLFVAAASELRPRLHRFCARMCGSSLDGEDVVQETLADAFYNLSSLKDATRFEPWMFRIAYHKCIDFLRREQRREQDVPFEDEHDRPDVSEADGILDTPIDEALATLVGELPPKERASVLLKDVLGYPLTEVAEIADSTLGGAKAALHRGRAKLRAVKGVPSLTELDINQRRLFEAYAECFNRRDWDALRHLVGADARLEIVGEAQGPMVVLGATYSGNYTGLPWEWRLTAGVVDGTPVIVHWRRSDSAWYPHSAIRLWWNDGQVLRIRDYIHVDYLLRHAQTEAVV